MALQFEDVVDCLKVLYPAFDFVFLFDHSQGHARKREGALDAKRMSKNYGGVQPKMRETTIDAAAGFLGPHEHELRLPVGAVQQMVFQPEDLGPWYIENVDERRGDKQTGRSRRVKKTRLQLIADLEAALVGLQKDKNYSIKDLQEFARINSIDLYVDKAEIIQGWEGQPKGLLQVLWERGFIDPKLSVNCYTLDGKKDPITGDVDNSTSLRHLMGCCIDFKEEETALEYLGAQLGVTVQLTPKFHAELAGEGVEYSWAHAKGYYRRLPVSQKKGRENFMQLVKDCTCPV
jgi:hypothetical protein